MALYRELRPYLIALFLAVLVSAQVWAFARQVQLGYRPFVRAPQRVPLSWDMFAPALERCSLEWSPALQINGNPVRAMHELGLRMEWDAVLDRAEDYEQMGHWACYEFGAEHTRMTITCFHPQGRTTRRELPCH